MKKGIGSFCNGDASTSTLNQQNVNSSFFFDSSTNEGESSSPPTLEEMILQLELEEEIARKAKLRENDEIKRRMSCVNNSDILRSARFVGQFTLLNYSCRGHDIYIIHEKLVYAKILISLCVSIPFVQKQS